MGTDSGYDGCYDSVSVPVTNVCDFGYLYNRGTVVTCDDAAVLPAITIDLSKANYQEVTPVYSTDINNHIN